ncbi:DUF1080 domain-containing protein [candidate division KSB1 bacterium]
MKAYKTGILIAVMSITVLLNCADNGPVTMFDGRVYDLEAMYDESQPQPPVVTPQPSDLAAVGKEAPPDAIVLFDGTDLSQWVDARGNPAGWKVENGYMEVGARGIRTQQSFGSCELHIEWAAPAVVQGSGQERGNSGVYLMGLYEIQVLDSYNNPTYPAGMAASVYGQNPPMVNASLPPGEWQSYDIIFRRPVFEEGRIASPAAVTVYHNGVLVQDDFKLFGDTVFKKVPEYEEHPDKLPLSLQNHTNPVRFRNIWIRELPIRQ